MASEPLDEAIANLKIEAPSVRIPADIQAHVITEDRIAVIAHPSNPVRSLNKEQVKALMTGTIKSWQDVGGSHPKVAVVLALYGSGTRKLFKKLALDDQEYESEAIEASGVDAVIERVSEMPEAIGAVSAAVASEAAKSGKVKIIETTQYSRTLLFVTLGEPNPKVRKVIDFFKGEGQKFIK